MKSLERKYKIEFEAPSDKEDKNIYNFDQLIIDFSDEEEEIDSILTTAAKKNK